MMENDKMKRRRVVTGQDANGKSVVVSDCQVDALTASAVPGYAWYRLWSTDEIPAVPNAGDKLEAPFHFPPPGGVRFNVFSAPPSSERAPSDLDEETAEQELEQKFPGRASHMESDQAGLHTTASIDFIYVVEGEIWLELDDKQEVHLQAGDSVIQNGVRHAWRNYSDKTCTMVICLVGSSPSS